MGHSGPVERCCCDEMKRQKAMTEEMTDKAACCDFDAELSVKFIDIDADQPVVFVDGHPSDPPQWLAIFILFFILWPALVRLSSDAFRQRRDDDPGRPGTQTWLDTSRLRL